jgi:hypothetical protein
MLPPDELAEGALAEEAGDELANALSHSAADIEGPKRGVRHCLATGLVGLANSRCWALGRLSTESVGPETLTEETEEAWEGVSEI